MNGRITYSFDLINFQQQKKMEIQSSRLSSINYSSLQNYRSKIHKQYEICLLQHIEKSKQLNDKCLDIEENLSKIQDQKNQNHKEIIALDMNLTQLECEQNFKNSKASRLLEQIILLKDKDQGLELNFQQQRNKKLELREQIHCLNKVSVNIREKIESLTKIVEENYAKKSQFKDKIQAHSLNNPTLKERIGFLDQQNHQLLKNTETAQLLIEEKSEKLEKSLQKHNQNVKFYENLKKMQRYLKQDVKQLKKNLSQQNEIYEVQLDKEDEFQFYLKQKQSELEQQRKYIEEYQQNIEKQIHEKQTNQTALRSMKAYLWHLLEQNQQIQSLIERTLSEDQSIKQIIDKKFKQNYATKLSHFLLERGQGQKAARFESTSGSDGFYRKENVYQ